MQDFIQQGIKIPYGAAGNIKTTCPACTPHDRKPENRNAKDLSVNITEGVWNCHNCGWKGSLKEKQEKQYFIPPVIELPLSEKVISWFDGRGIKANTLKKFFITEKKEWMPQEKQEVTCILFPFIKYGQWVNIKYRDSKKNFKLSSGAELALFNFDAIEGHKRVVITEGEIDCMSVYQAGFYHVCSVPNGASKGNQNLSYIDTAWHAFNEADEIIIATDNDEAGIMLRNELVRRLGRERCKVAIYPQDCKDFNEVLVKHGANKVLDAINAAQYLPVEGIHRVSDYMRELEEVYQNGFAQGVGVGWADFDELLNFSGGQVTGITGVPNSGKSAFADNLAVRLAACHGWKAGVCSFENQPVTKHISNLSGVYCGKPLYQSSRVAKMSLEEFVKTTSFMHDVFFFFKMADEDTTMKGILSRAKQLVKTHGIKLLYIDPYNYIEHNRKNGQTETEYISELLNDLCNFAKNYDVHVIIVVHPVKMAKQPNGEYEVPTLYNLSGSAHWFNKLDNGIAVHRNRVDNTVNVHVQKVRFHFNGKLGVANFMYDVFTGRYRAENEPSFYSMLYRTYDNHSQSYQLSPDNPNPYAGMQNNVQGLYKEKPF